MRELPAVLAKRRSIQGTIGQDRPELAPVLAGPGPAVYSPRLTRKQPKTAKTAELVNNHCFPGFREKCEYP